MAPNPVKNSKRVAIIGPSGMGKTSLFNMLCGANAPIARDAPYCTAEEKETTCNLDNRHACIVRDTGGFPEEGSRNFIANFFKTSKTEELQKRLKKLVREEELHLLIYCMSAKSRNKKKLHAAHYSMFKSVGVPIVVVVTNLELWSHPLERWWSMNEALLNEIGMDSSAGHACVTTLPILNLTGTEIPLHYESQRKVKVLIASKIYASSTSPTTQEEAQPDSAPSPTTQEETQPESAPLSYLDTDATNPFAISDITEEGRNNPYDDFFNSSHSSLHLPLSGPSLIRLFRSAFVPSQERFKRRFLKRRAPSPSSPLEPSTNNEPTEPTPDGKVRVGEERNKDVDLPDCSANIKPDPAKENKGKQQQEPTDAETLPSDDASSTTEFDTNENSTLWKVLRARGKYNTTQMTHGPSREVVYACRKQQGYVAWKPKRKAKSATLTTGALTTAAQASGSSQAGPSSHGRPVHGHTSSLGQAGVSSQSIAGYEDQPLQVAGGLATYSMDDLSGSDSIQGSCNKFLDRICFPR